jgi:transporter family-2 protein
MPYSGAWDAGALLIGLTGWESGALGPLKNAHPLLLTAGVLGARLVFAIAWLIPRQATQVISSSSWWLSLGGPPVIVYCWDLPPVSWVTSTITYNVP